MSDKDYRKLHGLERQKAYIEHTNSLGLGGDSFFKIDKVVESMRDSGYRDIRKAINDIVDNSIQAEANRIAIMTTSERGKEKGSREKISNIAIIDDGYGMIPEMIRAAVSWGGTDRHNSRDGLGRFGFGLPTAAVSVTRKYEVFSKTIGEEWFRVRVDLNEIAEKSINGAEDSSVVPGYVKQEPPKYVKDYIKKIWSADDLEQGTVVLLREPDRIRNFSLPSIFQAKMLQNIGLIYRHFFKNHAFFVNEVKSKLIDPLFLNPNGIGYDAGNGYLAEGMDDLVFDVKHKNGRGENVTGSVRLQFSFMHPSFARDKKGSEIKNRMEVLKDNNGYFMVCRSGRQVDVVRRPTYEQESLNTVVQNNDRYWQIELHFEPILDDLFGITTNKQQVEIDEKVWNLLREMGVPEIVKGLRDRDKQLRADRNAEKDKNTDTGYRDSENVMAETEKFDSEKVSAQKQDEANKKLKEDAKKKAEESGENPETVEQELTKETNERKYKVEFTKLPGAPFYNVDYFGTQFRILINTRHRFYTDVYSHLDERGKTAMELLFFVLGKSEIKADGEKEDFYLNERYEWSKKLDVALKILDRKDPIGDKESAEEEEREMLEAGH